MRRSAFGEHHGLHRFVCYARSVILTIFRFDYTRLMSSKHSENNRIIELSLNGDGQRVSKFRHLMAFENLNSYSKSTKEAES